MSQLDQELRERLVEEFRACLEAATDLPNETESGVDLHSLFSELAVLKNEIRLESRQFKTALEEMRTFTSELRDNHVRLARELEHGREQIGVAKRQAERALLLELLDLRDRLDAGLAALPGHRPGWLARCFARSTLRFLRGFQEGQSLTLRRLDLLLERHGVRPIETASRALDPAIMNVVATQDQPHSAEGWVLAEQRRGFLHHGELLRCAEVIVNKRQA
jgi:molecular chaperone GrpE